MDLPGDKTGTGKPKHRLPRHPLPFWLDPKARKRSGRLHHQRLHKVQEHLLSPVVVEEDQLLSRRSHFNHKSCADRIDLMWTVTCHCDQRLMKMSSEVVPIFFSGKPEGHLRLMLTDDPARRLRRKKHCCHSSATSLMSEATRHPGHLNMRLQSQNRLDPLSSVHSRLPTPQVLAGRFQDVEHPWNMRTGLSRITKPFFLGSWREWPREINRLGLAAPSLLKVVVSCHLESRVLTALFVNGKSITNFFFSSIPMHQFISCWASI